MDSDKQHAEEEASEAIRVDPAIPKGDDIHTAAPLAASTTASQNELDAQALADRIRWREMLEEYRQGNIDVDRRPLHIQALDLYLQEGGGFLTAPMPPDEEARTATLAHYMADVMQAYKQAGHSLDLDKYTRLASIACRAPIALLNFVDTDEQLVKSQYGLPAWQEKVMPRNQSFCAHTILKDDQTVFSVTDASKDWRFQGLGIVTGDEHVRWYAGVPLRTPEGHNIGAVCVIDTEPREAPDQRQKQALQDIAKMVMLELNPLAEQLVRQRQERVFLSSISHELRAPLHGLLASTEMLLDDSSSALGPSQSSYLQTIANCGNMLQDVIENVLSQRVSHKVRPEDTRPHIKALVDLPAFLEEVLDSTWVGKSVDHEKTADDVEVFVRSNLDKTNAAYRIDRGEIGRIVMNVFGNGIKYTSKGRIEVKLSAGDIEPVPGDSGFQQRVRLVFQDTGKGIAASYLPQLFTPFVQEDSLAEGYGLGMSMVKELVERNGGKTQVNSVEGQGTTITVELTLEVLPDIHPSPFAALRGKQYYASSYVKSSSITYKYVREMCAGFGMEECDTADADIVLVKETQEPIVEENVLQDVNQPTVLLTMQARPQPIPSRSRVMLVQGPLGPYKLGRAIMAALNVAQPSSSARRFSASTHRRPGISRNASSGPVMDMPSSSYFPTLKTQSSDGSSLLRTESGDSGVLSNPAPGNGQTPASSLSGMSSLSLSSDSPDDPHGQSPALSSSSSTTVRPSLGQRTSSLPVPDPSRMHCLIVDDNPINLQILRTTLERLGLSCVVAENGLEGFHRFAEASGAKDLSRDLHKLPPARPFDLVFMDVYMPLMNGIEATAKIRELEKELRRRKRRMDDAGRPRATGDLEGATPERSQPKTPTPSMAFEWCTVVAISGGGEEEETEMKAAGADYFFQRPFTGKDLKRFLAQLETDLVEVRSATRQTSISSTNEPSQSSALKNELSSA